MKLCVFCASNNSVADCYQQMANHLGQIIAEHGHTLIFGGASGGLMDAVAKGVYQSNGEVIGVTLQRLLECGRRSDFTTQLHVVETLQQRKSLMTDLCDAYIVLPGGFGTLDEMFDALSGYSLGYHHKPLFVINTNNYFEGLKILIQRMDDEHLSHPDRGFKPIFCDTPDNCITTIEQYIQ